MRGQPLWSGFAMNGKKKLIGVALPLEAINKGITEKALKLPATARAYMKQEG